MPFEKDDGLLDYFNGKIAAAEGTTTPDILKYANGSPEEIASSAGLIADLRDYYSERGINETDEELKERFYQDRNNRDINTVYMLGGLTEALSSSNKERDARLNAAWDKLPAFWEKGGRGWSAIPDIAQSIVTDPFNLLGPGSWVAKSMARKAAVEGVESITKSVLAGAGTEAAFNASIGAAAETANQARDIELGIRNEYDLGQVGAAAGLTGAIGGVAGGIGGIFDARAGREEGRFDRAFNEATAENEARSAPPPVPSAETAPPVDPEDALDDRLNEALNDYEHQRRESIDSADERRAEYLGVVQDGLKKALYSRARIIKLTRDIEDDRVHGEPAEKILEKEQEIRALNDFRRKILKAESAEQLEALATGGRYDPALDESYRKRDEAQAAIDGELGVNWDQVNNGPTFEEADANLAARRAAEKDIAKAKPEKADPLTAPPELGILKTGLSPADPVEGVDYDATSVHRWDSGSKKWVVRDELRAIIETPATPATSSPEAGSSQAADVSPARPEEVDDLLNEANEFLRGAGGNLGKALYVAARGDNVTASAAITKLGDEESFAADVSADVNALTLDDLDKRSGTPSNTDENRKNAAKKDSKDFLDRAREVTNDFQTAFGEGNEDHLRIFNALADRAAIRASRLPGHSVGAKLELLRTLFENSVPQIKAGALDHILKKENLPNETPRGLKNTDAKEASSTAGMAQAPNPTLGVPGGVGRAAPTGGAFKIVLDRPQGIFKESNEHGFFGKDTRHKIVVYDEKTGKFVQKWYERPDKAGRKTAEDRAQEQLTLARMSQVGHEETLERSKLRFDEDGQKEESVDRLSGKDVRRSVGMDPKTLELYYRDSGSRKRGQYEGDFRYLENISKEEVDPLIDEVIAEKRAAYEQEVKKNIESPAENAVKVLRKAALDARLSLRVRELEMRRAELKARAAKSTSEKPEAGAKPLTPEQKNKAEEKARQARDAGEKRLLELKAVMKNAEEFAEKHLNETKTAGKGGADELEARRNIALVAAEKKFSDPEDLKLAKSAIHQKFDEQALLTRRLNYESDARSLLRKRIESSYYREAATITKATNLSPSEKRAAKARLKESHRAALSELDAGAISKAADYILGMGNRESASKAVAKMFRENKKQIEEQYAETPYLLKRLLDENELALSDALTRANIDPSSVDYNKKGASIDHLIKKITEAAGGGLPKGADKAKVAAALEEVVKSLRAVREVEPTGSDVVNNFIDEQLGRAAALKAETPAPVAKESVPLVPLSTIREMDAPIPPGRVVVLVAKPGTRAHKRFMDIEKVPFRVGGVTDGVPRTQRQILKNTNPNEVEFRFGPMPPDGKIHKGNRVAIFNQSIPVSHYLEGVPVQEKIETPGKDLTADEKKILQEIDDVEAVDWSNIKTIQDLKNVTNKLAGLYLKAPEVERTSQLKEFSYRQIEKILKGRDLRVVRMLQDLIRRISSQRGPKFGQTGDYAHFVRPSAGGSSANTIFLDPSDGSFVEDFIHELGHWAWANMLSTSDKAEFYNRLAKFFDKTGGFAGSKLRKNLPYFDGEGNAIIIENLPDTLNSSGKSVFSPKEYFANQFVQFVMSSGRLGGSRTFWQRIGDYVGKIIDLFFDRTKVDRDLIPLFERILPPNRVAEKVTLPQAKTAAGKALVEKLDIALNLKSAFGRLMDDHLKTGQGPETAKELIRKLSLQTEAILRIGTMDIDPEIKKDLWESMKRVRALDPDKTPPENAYIAAFDVERALTLASYGLRGKISEAEVADPGLPNNYKHHVALLESPQLLEEIDPKKRVVLSTLVKLNNKTSDALEEITRLDKRYYKERETGDSVMALQHGMKALFRLGNNRILMGEIGSKYNNRVFSSKARALSREIYALISAEGEWTPKMKSFLGEDVNNVPLDKAESLTADDVEFALSQIDGAIGKMTKGEVFNLHNNFMPKVKEMLERGMRISQFHAARMTETGMRKQMFERLGWKRALGEIQKSRKKERIAQEQKALDNAGLEHIKPLHMTRTDLSEMTVEQLLDDARHAGTLGKKDVAQSVGREIARRLREVDLRAGMSWPIPEARNIPDDVIGMNGAKLRDELSLAVANSNTQRMDDILAELHVRGAAKSTDGTNLFRMRRAFMTGEKLLDNTPPPPKIEVQKIARTQHEIKTQGGATAYMDIDSYIVRDGKIVGALRSAPEGEKNVYQYILRATGEISADTKRRVFEYVDDKGVIKTINKTDSPEVRAEKLDNAFALYGGGKGAQTSTMPVVHPRLPLVRRAIAEELDEASGKVDDDLIGESVRADVKEIMKFLTHRDKDVEADMRLMFSRMAKLLGHSAKEALDESNVFDTTSLLKLLGKKDTGARGLFVDLRGADFIKFRNDLRRIAIGLRKGGSSPFDIAHEIGHMIMATNIYSDADRALIVQAFKSSDDKLAKTIRSTYSGKVPEGADPDLYMANEWFAEGFAQYLASRVAKGNVWDAARQADAGNWTVELKGRLEEFIDRMIETFAYVVNGLLGKNDVKQLFRKATIYGDMRIPFQNSPAPRITKSGGISPKDAPEYVRGLSEKRGMSRKHLIKNFTNDFSYNGGKPLVVYHATPHGAPLRKDLNPTAQLLPSKNGDVGPGVYVTENADIAGHAYIDVGTGGSRDAVMDDSLYPHLTEDKRVDARQALEIVSEATEYLMALRQALRGDDGMLKSDALSDVVDLGDDPESRRSRIIEEIKSIEESVSEAKDFLAELGVEGSVLPLYMRIEKHLDLTDEIDLSAPSTKRIIESVEVELGADAGSISKALVAGSSERVDGVDFYYGLARAAQDWLVENRGVQHDLDDSDGKVLVQDALRAEGYDAIKTTHVDPDPSGRLVRHTAWTLFDSNQVKHVEADHFNGDSPLLYESSIPPETITAGAARTLATGGKINPASFSSALVANGVSPPMASALSDVAKGRLSERAVSLLGNVGKHLRGSVSYARLEAGARWFADKVAPEQGTGIVHQIQSARGRSLGPILAAFREVEGEGAFKEWARYVGSFGGSWKKIPLQGKRSDEVMDALRRGDDSKLDAAQKKLYHAFRKAMDDEKKALVDADTAFRSIKENYVPQVWDAATILGRADEFKAALAEYFIDEHAYNRKVLSREDAAVKAQRVFESLVSSDGVLLPPGSEPSGSSANPLEHSRMIQLHRVDSRGKRVFAKNYEKLAPFLEKNILGVATKYFNESSLRVATDKAFGRNGMGFFDYMHIAEAGREGAIRLMVKDKTQYSRWKIVSDLPDVDVETDSMAYTLIKGFDNVEYATKAIDAVIEKLRTGMGTDRNKAIQEAKDILIKSRRNTRPADARRWEHRVDAVVNGLADFAFREKPLSTSELARIEGTYRRMIHKPHEIGKSYDQATFKASRGIKAFNAATLLGFTVATSLTDVVLPIVRSGSFRAAWKATSNLRKDPTYREALKNVGLSISQTTSKYVTAIHGDMALRGEQAFYEAIGLNAWTSAMREMAGAVAFESFVAAQKKLLSRKVKNAPSDREHRRLMRFMAEYGMLDYVEPGAKALTPEAMADPVVANALIKFADNSIFQPGFHDKPLWTQGPFGSVIWQLKSYPMAFQGLVGHVMDEAQQGNWTPAIYLLTLGTGMGMTSNALKDFIQSRGGEDERSPELRKRSANKIVKAFGLDGIYGIEDESDADKVLGNILEGITAAGGLGLFASMLYDTAAQLDNGAYGYVKMSSVLLGPAAGTAYDAYTVAAGAMDQATDMLGGEDDGNAKERAAVRAFAARVPVFGRVKAFSEGVTDAVAGESESGGGWGSW